MLAIHAMHLPIGAKKNKPIKVDLKKAAVRRGRNNFRDALPCPKRAAARDEISTHGVLANRRKVLFSMVFERLTIDPWGVKGDRGKAIIPAKIERLIAPGHPASSKNVRQALARLDDALAHSNNCPNKRVQRLCSHDTDRVQILLGLKQ